VISHHCVTRLLTNCLIGGRAALNKNTVANGSGLSARQECRLSETDPSKPEARYAVPSNNDSMQAGITAETALQGMEQMMRGVHDHLC